MLVWIVILAYLVWCAVAPKSVLRVFEWQIGSKPRFGETAIRVGAAFFIAFLIVLLLVTKH